MRLLKTLFVLAAAVAAFSGAAHAGEAGRKTLTVAAAADLTGALGEAAAAFEKATGARVTLSFGSTGRLARQIAGGAPFDLFLAADTEAVRSLAKDGRIVPESVTAYAEGFLALAVNRASGVEAKGLKDLLDPRIKRVAIANPEHAPYGKAAVEALKGAGVYDRIKDKIVYGENIRQALQFVQTGDAPAGIVALSIAGVPEVTYVRVDPGLHGRIEQAAGVVSSSRERALASSFILFLGGAEGRAILGKYGFKTPGN